MRTSILEITVACLAFATPAVAATTRFVDVNSTNSIAPYVDWGTAASNIQDAVDAADLGDLILVTNGVYETGGRVVFGAITNRVAVTKPVTVQSVNGPTLTTIKGYQMPGAYQGLGSNAIRCVYLTNQARLVGFTVTGGATLTTGDQTKEASGGGVWSENGVYRGVVSNCVVVGNSASFYGGGVYGAYCYNSVIFANIANFGGGMSGSGSYVYNSLIISNLAQSVGGGIETTYMYNCVVVGNHAGTASGGISSYFANSSIIYYNSASIPPQANYGLVTMGSCCTTPLPPSPGNNFTNEPLFVNTSVGDFHLQSNSPCINAGLSSTSQAYDLDGNPRLVAGAVDIGAYEFQTPASIVSYAWLLKYGFANDGTADNADPDNDGMGNYGEWRAGTVPTNPASVFRLTSVTNTGSGVRITWQGGPVIFVAERATNSAAPLSFVTVRSNLGTSFTDTTATNDGPYFYRVRVQE